jgi:ligand-binding sensor domain-containing protein
MLSKSLTCFFVFLAFFLRGQWENYTNSDVAYSLAEQGNYLWVATKGGLTRIDRANGSQIYFTRANTPFTSIVVRKVVSDQQNTIWVITGDNQLFSFDGATWSHIDATNSPIQVPVNDMVFKPGRGLYVWDANSIHILKDNKWTQRCAPPLSAGLYFNGFSVDSSGCAVIGIKGGIVISKPTGCSTIIATTYTGNPTYVISTAVDSHNNIWCTVWYGQVWKFDGGSWTYYDQSSGLNFCCMNKVYVDHQDSVWLLSSHLCKFNGTKWRDLTGYCCSFPGRDLLLDVYGDLYAAGYGLQKWGNNTWNHIPVSNCSIPGVDVRSVFADSKNRKWFSTSWPSYGPSSLIRYNDTAWTNYSFTTAVNYFQSREDSQGRIWSTTDIGIISWDGTSWIKVAAAPAVFLFLFEIDKLDVFWASSGGNLYSISGGSWSTYSVNYYITDIEILNSNERLIATIGGIQKMTGSQFTTINTSNSALPNDTVLSIKKDSKGRIWASTAKGLAMLSGGAWTVYNTGNSSLPTNKVGKIAIDKNDQLWLLGPEGLIKFDPANCHYYRVYNSGIIRGASFDIGIDQNDWKWITTEGGVSVFKGNGPPLSVDIPDLNPIVETGIYPSPARETLNVRIGEDVTNGCFELFNVGGELIRRCEFSGKETTVNIATIGAGIYIYHIKNAGQIVRYGKVSVE